MMGRIEVYNDWYRVSIGIVPLAASTRFNVYNAKMSGLE